MKMTRMFFTTALYLTICFAFLPSAKAIDSLNVTQLDQIYDYWADVNDIDQAGDYVYIIGAHSGLHILNVSDEANPEKEGFVHIVSAVRLTISGDYAYVASHSGDGSRIHIINISNPEEPYTTATIINEVNTHIDMNVNGDFLFITSYSYTHEEYQGRISAYNISDPTNPVLESTFNLTGYFCNFAIYDDCIFLPISDTSDNFLKILDISNPSSISEISTTLIETEPYYFDRSRILVEGTHAYISADDDLYVIDISDTSSPELVGNIQVEWDIEEIGFRNGIIYSVNNILMRLIDVSDPTQPTVINTFEPLGLFITFSIKNDTMFMLVGPYASSEPTGWNMEVLDISDDENISRMAFFNNRTDFTKMIQYDDYLFISSSDNKTVIADISDPSNMVAATEIDLSFRDICINGDVLYGVGVNNFNALNIANPLDPQFIFADSNEENVVKLYTSGNYLFTFNHLNDENNLSVYDISDQTVEPIFRSTFTQDLFYLNDLAVIENRLYLVGSFRQDVNDEIHNFMVLELHVDGTLSTTNISSLSDYHNFYEIIVEGTYAYISNHNVSIIDISNPAEPILVSTFIEESEMPNSLALEENRLAYAKSDGLRVIDVSDPTNPVESGHYLQTEWGHLLTLKDGYAYMANNQRLRSFDLTQTSEVSDDPSKDVLPGEFSLTSVYPNPFNPTLNITITLPEAMDLRVTVSNVLGQEVAVISNQVYSAGNHNLTFDGTKFSSGIYFIKASATNHLDQVQKVILMK